MFKASRNWPYYQKEPVYLDRRSGQFYVVRHGRRVPCQNPIAAAYAAQFQPNGRRKR